MANQGNHGRDKGSQPTWRDVAKGLEYLEREYGGHAQVVMDKEGAERLAEGMFIYVELFGDFNPATGIPVHVARAVWPTMAHKEMASMVLRLIHSCDHMADAARRAKSDGRMF